MNLASQVFQGLYAEASPRQFGGLDLSHWFSTRQVRAQEGSLLKGFPTWRYRVLRTALRLRPRRALSSASGQKCILAQNISNQKIFELFNVTDLTNHIPVLSWLKTRGQNLHNPIPVLIIPRAVVAPDG